MCWIPLTTLDLKDAHVNMALIVAMKSMEGFTRLQFSKNRYLDVKENPGQIFERMKQNKQWEK